MGENFYTFKHVVEMLVLAFSVAIGICTHNDVKTLPKLFNSLLSIIKKSLNSEYLFHELIVVSSGSTDGTNDVIENYRSEFQNYIQYKPVFQAIREGKASAVNVILSENASEYLIFIPADVNVCYDSLIHLILKITQNPLIGAVSGRPVPLTKYTGHKGLKKALHLIWNLHNETLKELSSRGLNSHSSGELMIIKTGIVQSIPGDIINDDAYIAVKIRSMGYLISYEPASKVSIEVPHTVDDYITQRKRVLIGHKQLTQTGKDPSNFRSIIRVAPLFGLKLLFRSIKSLDDFIGLLHAILLELKIELSIRSNKPIRENLTKNMVIWSRVNQI